MTYRSERVSVAILIAFVVAFEIFMYASGGWAAVLMIPILAVATGVLILIGLCLYKLST